MTNNSSWNIEAFTQILGNKYRAISKISDYQILIGASYQN